MKRVALVVAVILVLAGVFRAGVAYGQNTYGTPKTVIHVVTGKWNAEATDEQKQAALEGVRTMASKIPGIKNVWLKADRIQPREYNYAFAIEFESRAAAAAYAEHPAHDEWSKPYLEIRAESRSYQLTNE